jgi:hypothetical protein
MGPVVMKMRFAWLVIIGSILILPPVIYIVRTRDPAKRGRSLKGAGLILSGMYMLFFGSFIVGETVTDPGGWAAAGWIAAWLAPLIGLALLAWYRPAWATMIFAVLMAGVVGIYVWSAIAPQAWGSFEDSVGPVRGIISFAIAVPVALLGWKRPLVAGAILVALPALPAILVAIAAAGGPSAAVGPIAVVTGPPGVTGILYLMSAAVGKGSPSKPEERSSPLSAKAA